MEVLDCTLRDGGYYNAWDFPDALVTGYLDAMEELAVDWVEIGFRTQNVRGFAGRYQFCTDEWLGEILSGRRLKIAVMIDGKSFTHEGWEESLSALFVPCEDSPADMVRITATASTLPAILPVAGFLRDLGYMASIQLMRGSLLSEDEVRSVVGSAKGGPVDYFYLADSFGGMLPAEISTKIAIIKEEFGGLVGFHPHDNLGLAMANTFSAMDAGADIVDCSVMGMGRGAGNLKTEQLFLLLPEAEQRCFDALFELIFEHFADLHKRYGWGASLPYMLSAVQGVHPTYAQNLLTVSRYSPMEVLGVLDLVRDSGSGDSFSADLLSNAVDASKDRVAPNTIPVEDLSGFTKGFSMDGWDGESVLVVGSGPSVEQRGKDIAAFADRSGSLVLECNFQDSFPTCPLHANLFLNAQKLRRAGALVGSRGQSVLGLRRVSSEVAGSLGDTPAFSWPAHVKTGAFEVNAEGCTIPSDVVGMYAIALALHLGAKRIFLAGFDGYVDAGGSGLFSSEQINAEREMEEFISILSRQPMIQSGETEIRSLTPTIYPLDQGGLYDS